MRVVMSYQPNTLAQQFTVDILYGCAVLRTTMLCRCGVSPEETETAPSQRAPQAGVRDWKRIESFEQHGGPLLYSRGSVTVALVTVAAP